MAAWLGILIRDQIGSQLAP